MIKVASGPCFRHTLRLLCSTDFCLASTHHMPATAVVQQAMPTAKLPAVCWASCSLAMQYNLLPALSTTQLLPRLEGLIQPGMVAGACDERDLLQLASGFSMVRHQPSDAVRRLHEQSTARLLRAGRMRVAEAVGLMDAYRQLKWDVEGLARLLRAVSLHRMAAAATHPAYAGPAGQIATQQTQEGEVGSPSSVLSAPVTPGQVPAAVPGSTVEPLSSRELLQLAVAYVRASLKPGPTWLQAHEACAVQLLLNGHMAAGQAQALLQCYVLLAHRPRGLHAAICVQQQDAKEGTPRQPAG